jgi:hypothetical protein
MEGFMITEINKKPGTGPFLVVNKLKNRRQSSGGY